MKLLSSAKPLMLLSTCVEEAGFSKSFFPSFELQPKEGFFFFLRGKISTSEKDEFWTVVFVPAVCYGGKGSAGVVSHAVILSQWWSGFFLFLLISQCLQWEYLPAPRNFISNPSYLLPWLLKQCVGTVFCFVFVLMEFTHWEVNDCSFSLGWWKTTRLLLWRRVEWVEEDETGIADRYVSMHRLQFMVFPETLVNSEINSV